MNPSVYGLATVTSYSRIVVIYTRSVLLDAKNKF